MSSEFVRPSRSTRSLKDSTERPRHRLLAVGAGLGTRFGVESEIRFLGDLAAGNFLPEPEAPADRLGSPSS